MLTECLQLFNFDLYKWFEGYRITLWVTFWWNIEYFSFFSPHAGVDPGFFLGGGALVSCSTSTPINRIVFFWRIPVVLENRRSSLEGGGAHPLHPPPRSAPDMWVELVVGFLLCSWIFFSGYSSFPLSSKTKIFKSNLTRNQVDEEPLSGCVTSKSSFIYLFYLTKKTFCGKKAQLAVYQWSSLACLLASSLTSRSSPNWRGCVHRLGYHW